MGIWFGFCIAASAALSWCGASTLSAAHRPRAFIYGLTLGVLTMPTVTWLLLKLWPQAPWGAVVVGVFAGVVATAIPTLLMLTRDP